MKTKILSLTLALLLLFSAACLFACKQDEEPAPVDEGFWSSAVHKEDATLGDGAKTFSVKVEAGDKSITLTIKTDKTTLSEAMKEHGLLSGNNGLYDTVNGLLADWDKDQAYWLLYKDGEMTAYGADDATVSGGEEYAWVYTK